MKRRSKNKGKKPAQPAKATKAAGPAKAAAPTPTPTAKAEAKPAAATNAVRREPTVDEIRNRAYQRFLSRGGAPGHMIEDWVAAERELRADRN